MNKQVENDVICCRRSNSNIVDCENPIDLQNITTTHHSFILNTSQYSANRICMRSPLVRPSLAQQPPNHFSYSGNFIRLPPSFIFVSVHIRNLIIASLDTNISSRPLYHFCLCSAGDRPTTLKIFDSGDDFIVIALCLTVGHLSNHATGHDAINGAM